MQQMFLLLLDWFYMLVNEDAARMLNGMSEETSFSCYLLLERIDSDDSYYSNLIYSADWMVIEGLLTFCSEVYDCL